jgi:hypothetical protein
MINLHPSVTAGDGREIDQSRSIKKVDKLDNMIACAQCGFIVDLTKRTTGDSQGAIPSGGATANSATVTPPSPGIAFTDAYADPVDTRSGCPFCNSMNPRAHDRGRTGFERARHSVENL